jgi:hypothetical protein
MTRTLTKIISNGPNVRSSEGAGTTTLTSSDNPHQIFNLSAARTLVMPTTGVPAGARYIVENRTDQSLTIQSSNATDITIANGANQPARVKRGRCTLVALQNNPTTPAHWLVVEVIEEGVLTYVNSAGDVTVASGTCRSVPFLNIQSGHTYTVNGHMLCGGKLTVSGTLVASGTVVVN